MVFCTYCGQSFTRDEHLERHILTHTNVKPFKCFTCHMSFARRDLLQRHYTLHGRDQNNQEGPPPAGIIPKSAGRNPPPGPTETDTKAAICTYCGQSFARDKYLERHILIHTNVKPFKCFTCHMSFAHRDLLQRHYTLHGRDQNNQEGPPPAGIIPKSAGRIPIACINCAKAKTKCDNKFPCSRCAQRNVKCMLRRTRRASKNVNRVGAPADGSGIGNSSENSNNNESQHNSGSLGLLQSQSGNNRSGSAQHSTLLAPKSVSGHQSQRTQLIPGVELGSKRSYAEFSAQHSISADVSMIATPSILTIQEGEDRFIESDTQLPYKHIKNLGHGHSAIVEMVKDVNTGSVFARKVFRIYGRHHERRSIFENEIKIIRRLAPHHHVIRIFATYVTEQEVGLILHPVADSGDLEAFLHDFKSAKAAQLVQPEKTKILESSFGCLVSGLAFMHRQNIRHKDIKPNNILIHEDSMIYTDFGYSLDHSTIGRSTTTGKPHTLTRKYCAPEVSDWEPRNSKSDIFSLGCVFLEILFVLHEEPVLPNYSKPYHDSLEELRSSLRDLNRLGMITSDMLHRRPEDRSSAEVITSELRHYEADLFCDKCKAVM